ncbi:MAG: SIS domain-containing protein [Lachnospiraceae bacterium]|jgi:D-sedoheptulose 7-phosphate isomerase|nr:SIS domain-containing protein [Lachnospiraceae bacterium]
MNAHLEDLALRRPALARLMPDIEKVGGLMVSAYRSNGKMLVCGNGGSLADAEHIAGELMKGFALTRPVNVALQANLKALGEPELASKLQTPLRTINLSTLPALSTAFANDVEADYVYAQLALAYTDPGDVFFAISTSGNSRNIHYAAVTAKALGARLVGLTGADGGQMRASGLYEVLIMAPESVTHLIQEEHIAIYHALCLMVEEEMFGVKHD